jgi:hypothetical protein
MECYLCFEKKNCVIKCKNCNLHACTICKETWKKKNYGIYNCPYRCDITKQKPPNLHCYSYLFLLIVLYSIFYIIIIFIKNVLFLHYFF